MIENTNHYSNISILSRLAYGSEGLSRRTGRLLSRVLRTVRKGGDSTPIFAPLRYERSSNHIEEEDNRLLPSAESILEKLNPRQRPPARLNIMRSTCWDEIVLLQALVDFKEL